MIKQDLFGNIVIKSISFDQHEIIENILDLHCNGENIELDPTYSIGNFYNGRVKAPKYKYDINPQIEGVGKACASNLPLPDISIKTIMFDPPFLNGDPYANSKIGNRFSFFKTNDEMIEFYNNAMKEFYRILKPKGILIFKCQDITRSKLFLTHVTIINMAKEIGYYTKDLFILLSKQVMIGGNHQKQKHARKYHSYFIVMEKLSKNRVGDFAL